MIKPNSFLQSLGAIPHFRFNRELADLATAHGETPQLLQAVIEAKLVTKDEACRFWSEAVGFAYVDPLATLVTVEAIERIPLEVARKARILPLYLIEDVMTVAMTEPGNAELVRRLSQIAQCPVSPVFALPREIQDAIAVHYSTEKTLEQTLGELERNDLFDQPEMASERLAVLAEHNTVVQSLDQVLFFALRERATDIHIEPRELHSRVRFRVDGHLREILQFSSKLHRPLTSRIKILCNLDIAESRYPQDGRFSIPVGTQTANFRVSTMPSGFGEKVVIRLLAMGGSKLMSLDQQMMSQSILVPFRQLIRNPNGIVFVTGPTGSGKTTTLYSALNEINDQSINISTIEDPIEIHLEGITQTQINPQIDLTFASVLRSLLRQDPDVILIGEIRDLETAKIATEAALTGHVVFATLHTNTAPQAIVRLTEIGVEPYMVAPSVIGVLGQRLAARICENCKEGYTPEAAVLHRHFHDAGREEVTFYRGRGCPACRGTGYKGRVAFHELVLITEELRTLIAENRSAQDIAAAAAKSGYKPLRYDGLKKVMLGLTTIEEIEANTSFEWAAG